MGLVYLPGALPCFETFGNLPTDLVSQDGLIGASPASEMLDLIIIPGGSLIESQSIKGPLVREIIRMADSGKFVLGVCSGFQILSKTTNVGRLSSYPLPREGLGLLDADFDPLVCTDRVSANVVNSSFLTSEIGTNVSGFHCHTYGNVSCSKNSKPILVSHVKRLNYRKDCKDIVSGVSNNKGNVVGVTLHGLLDNNPVLMKGIMDSLKIGVDDLNDIRISNLKLIEKIKPELGVKTNIFPQVEPSKKTQKKVILVTALGSGSGKTFVVTGLASSLKMRGFKVGVLKIGGDVRDIVPALYMIKEPMMSYSSIRVGESGWMLLSSAINLAFKYYDFLIIEGAMSAFTGLFLDKAEFPHSTAEIAAMLGVSTIIVTGCEKEGIEGALLNTLNYVRVMRNLGVNVGGVVFNKMKFSYLTAEVKRVIDEAFKNSKLELIGVVPRLDLEGRGAIPEVEIKYPEFGMSALEVAEKYLDISKILLISGKCGLVDLDFEDFSEKFKKLLQEPSNGDNFTGESKNFDN